MGGKTEDLQCSIPSVKAMGDVVKVNRDVPATRKIKRKAIKIPCNRPSRVRVRNQNLKITLSPDVKKIFIKKVNAIINSRGFKPLSIYQTGTPVRATANDI